MTAESRARLVWDLPLRLFHWLLAASVLGCWITSRLGVAWFSWHTVLGYAVIVLVLFRIAWGFLGPRHARFRGFVRGPRAVWNYLRGLPGAAGGPPGHNPAGAWMVLLMLALTLALGITGLFANDEVFSTGALYVYVSDATSDSLTSLHSWLMDILWIAIALHVAAVLAYLFVKRQDLLTPMITGRKRAVAPEEEIDGSRAGLALLIAGLASLLLYVVIETAPELTRPLF